MLTTCHARMLAERIIILADKSIKIVTNLGVVFALHTICHKLQRWPFGAKLNYLCDESLQELYNRK